MWMRLLFSGLKSGSCAAGSGARNCYWCKDWSRRKRAPIDHVGAIRHRGKAVEFDWVVPSRPSGLSICGADAGRRTGQRVLQWGCDGARTLREWYAQCGGAGTSTFLITPLLQPSFPLRSFGWNEPAWGSDLLAAERWAPARVSKANISGTLTVIVSTVYS